MIIQSSTLYISQVVLGFFWHCPTGCSLKVVNFVRSIPSCIHFIGASMVALTGCFNFSFCCSLSVYRLPLSSNIDLVSHDLAWPAHCSSILQIFPHLENLNLFMCMCTVPAQVISTGCRLSQSWSRHVGAGRAPCFNTKPCLQLPTSRTFSFSSDCVACTYTKLTSFIVWIIISFSCLVALDRTSEDDETGCLVLFWVLGGKYPISHIRYYIRYLKTDVLYPMVSVPFQLLFA